MLCLHLQRKATEEATERVDLFWNSCHSKLESTQLGVRPQEEKGRSNSV